MSDRLTISAAFSILMMAGYVLFGADAARAPVGPGSAGTPVSISAPALPVVHWTLPAIR